MIGSFKPYRVCKDSGLPWIGQIPNDWKIERTKSCFRLSVEKSGVNHGRELLSVYTHIGVRPRKEMEERGNKATTTDHYWVVKRGDIVVNKLLAWMGAIGVSHYDGVTSPAYDILRPIQNVEPDYYHHLFRTALYSQQFKIRSRGIMEMRLRLYFDQFGQIPILIPPREQQCLIVRFIDHLDRRVRRYVHAKRRLVSLLNEQKQAIINRAITRGLDPNVRLKPSGVEWLGEVPEHWSLKRFKFVTRITSGQVDPREIENRNQILIAPNHIESGSGRITQEETAAIQGADSGKYQVRLGQIIYSKIRPNLRKAAIARTDCLCSADMYPIWPKESELRPKYLLMLLLSEPFTKYAVDCSMRVAMPKINRQALGECWLWYPRLSEQDAILAYLSQNLALPDAVATTARRELELVREYRTRLIADVVTGKLDVREAAAKLPDEAAEPETLDDADAMDDGDGTADDLDAVPEEVEA
ncbi:MAG: restriction endonuclease subunit S [Planctomycetota bacterium]